jgi:hypothetical protein
MAVTGRGAERGAGAGIALFFFACLLTASLFAPGPRHGRLRLETIRVGGFMLARPGPGHRGDDRCPQGPDQRTAGGHQR